MHRLLLTALGALFLPLPGFAQPSTPPVPWANKFFLPDTPENRGKPPPQVVEHDFGTVPQGTLCVHRFTVTNIYDVPVQITHVNKSCGCLDYEAPQRVLQPNEPAEFVVTMDTAKFQGPNAQTLKVTFQGTATDKTYSNTAVLRFTANSRTDVTLRPGAAAFGTVAQGAKAERTLALDYHGTQKEWKVTGVAASDAVDIEVSEATRGTLAGTKHYITVRLKANAPAGPFHEIVSLRTNDQSEPVIRLTVTGNVLAPLLLSTTRVEFGRVTVGQETTFNVMLRSADNGLFKVQGVADAGDGLSAEALDAPGPYRMVKVKFTPTKAGLFRKELVLKTDLKGGATATVVVEAEAVNP